MFRITSYQDRLRRIDWIGAVQHVDQIIKIIFEFALFTKPGGIEC